MGSNRVSSANLLLVPTELELRQVQSFLPEICEYASLNVCGFGPVAAAALTTRAIQRIRPRRVILAGIAGTFSPASLPVGSACCFQQVTVDGVGSGAATSFISAGDLGFNQVPGLVTGGPIADTLPLQTCGQISQHQLLLTCCAAADSTAMSSLRVARFPQAAAEDMEGYGVALACRLAGLPLMIVRGISNIVGNRDKETWYVDLALRAAAEALRSLISAPGESENQR